MLGLFLTKNSTGFDFDLLSDQVMILATNFDLLRAIRRDFTRLELTEDNIYTVNFNKALFSFHSFVEDSIKMPACVVVVDDSSEATMQYAKEVTSLTQSSITLEQFFQTTDIICYRSFC